MNDLTLEIENFCNYLLIDKHYSHNTIESYRRDLNKFKDFSKNLKLIDIDKDIIKKYLKYLNENKIKERSIARNISALKSFYKFLIIKSCTASAKYSSLSVMR